MKLYIQASTKKPTLSSVRIEWAELDDCIKYTIYSEDDDVLFEEIFEYADVDSDAIYDSAADMAILVLSQTYNLSDQVIQEIRKE